MHHDDVPYTLLIDFRGEKVTICYERPDPEGMTIWLADGREWPDDLTPEEVAAISEAIERDARERMAADKPYRFDVKQPTI